MASAASVALAGITETPSASTSVRVPDPAVAHADDRERATESHFSVVISPSKDHFAKFVTQTPGFFGVGALAVALEHTLKALLFVALGIQSGAQNLHDRSTP